MAKRVQVPWRRGTTLTLNGSDRQFSALNFLIPNDVIQTLSPAPHGRLLSEMEAFMLPSTTNLILSDER